MNTTRHAELTQALADVEKMIFSYAHWWKDRNPEMDLDDLAQEGRLGFCRAFERYRPNAGSKLSSYATPYIHQAMRRCVQFTRDTIRIKSLRFEDRIPMVGLDAPLGSADERTLADCLPAPEAEDGLATDVDLGRLVLRAVKSLPKKRREIVRARFFEGRTLASIGDDYGVSREAVRKQLWVAMQELRNHPLLKNAA